MVVLSPSFFMRWKIQNCFCCFVLFIRHEPRFGVKNSKPRIFVWAVTNLGVIFQEISKTYHTIFMHACMHAWLHDCMHDWKELGWRRPNDQRMSTVVRLKYLKRIYNFFLLFLTVSASEMMPVSRSRLDTVSLSSFFFPPDFLSDFLFLNWQGEKLFERKILFSYCMKRIRLNNK